MPIIQMPRGVLPVQVEFVGKDAEKIKRSCKGSLHLTAGCTKVISVGELNYIQENEEELFRKLHVVPLVEKKEADKEKDEETLTDDDQGSEGDQEGGDDTSNSTDDSTEDDEDDEDDEQNDKESEGNLSID